MAIDRAKFVARFVQEAHEHVQGLNSGLMALEKSPADADLLKTLARVAHTIKGSSRMLKLKGITLAAHKLEDALDSLGSGRIPSDKETFNALFKAVRMMQDMIEQTAHGADPSEQDAAPVAQMLEAIADHGQVQSTQPPAATPAQGNTESQQTSASAGTFDTVRVDATRLDALVKLSGEVLSQHGRLVQKSSELRDMEQSLQRLALEFQRTLPGEPATSQLQALRQSLRRLVAALRDDLTVHDLLVAELQERALSLRMLPLSTVLDSFELFVREVSASMGKQVSFEVMGAETEIDKKIIEQIGAPLMHMLRNSIDHGIEPGDERLKAGKPPAGRIVLEAFQEGGSVVVRLTDDGKGISTERIKQRAIKRGIADRPTLDAMTKGELMELIYKDGFSTSELITDISGRGVGMSVVREHVVERLGGSVEMQSSEGNGTTFTIRLPLNLAALKLLVVQSAGRSMALPARYVYEVLRVPTAELVEVLGKRALKLREQLVPVEKLNQVLGYGEEASANKKLHCLVVVVSTGIEKIGFIVEALLDECDMVAKPLPAHVRGRGLVSGVALDGQGRVLNILHGPELMRQARSMRAQGHQEPTKQALARSILVVDDSFNTREIEGEILRSYGYDVTLAADGQEGMDMALSRGFDLVITDVEMPRMDGFTLTTKLRAMESYAAIPIIIMTSRDKQEDRARGLQAGADAYIVKGAFDQSKLLDTVQSLLG